MRDRVRKMISIPVSQIVGFSGGNPKHRTDRDRDILDASLDAHGFLMPPLVRELGDGRYEIIDGHGRMERINSRGLASEIKVIVLDVESVAEGRRVLLALKHTAEWNFGALEDFIGSALADGAAVDELMSTSGLTAADVDALGAAGVAFLDDIERKAVERVPHKVNALAIPIAQDAVPDAPKKAVAKVGDVWRLGDHRVFCMDCTTIDHALLRIGELGFGFTSPPYNAGSNMLGGNKNMKESKYAESDDAMDADAYAALLDASTRLLLDSCRVACVNLQSLAANKRIIARWTARFADHLADRAVWFKGQGAPAMAANVLNSRFEDLFIFASDKKPSRALPTAAFRGDVSNVYEGAPSGNEYSDLHAATMPTHLAQWAIERLGSRADYVVDPFGGTGTTLVVAEQLGKRAALVELTPAYVDVIVERWQRLTGKSATRASV